MVVDEVSNIRICLDIDIQHEHLQQKHMPKSYFNNKVDWMEKIDKVLKAIYALFTVT